VAGTGTRLGWIVLSLLGATTGQANDAAKDAADLPNTDLPGRELLLYLAEFDAGANSIDPLDLEALPAAASGDHPAPAGPLGAVAGSTSGSTATTAREEDRDDSN
jgi:hypothetical protein